MQSYSWYCAAEMRSWSATVARVCEVVSVCLIAVRFCRANWSMPAMATEICSMPLFCWRAAAAICLAESAEQLLLSLGYDNITVLCRDGSLGLSEEASFDAIVVTAGADRFPTALGDQLAEGGRLVLPVGSRDSQTMWRYTRHGPDLHGEPLGDFVFVPEGGLHGFRNESGEPASLLILFAPGAPREAYFEGLVELAEGRWTPSHDELQEFLEKHDNIYV